MEDIELLRRLASVRYLYLQAVEQSRKPEPLSFPSLLLLHDAVELFLQAAADHKDVGKPNTEFMEYWPLLETVRLRLPEKTAMGRLNKARVALKHHSLFPSPLQLESFRATATTFFEVATPLVFEIEFGGISMISVVADEQVRKLLRKGETLAASGNIDEAMAELAVAFRRSLVGYRTRLVDKFGPDYPTFDTSIVTAAIVATSIGLSLRLVSLGLDYDGLIKFHVLTPTVHYAYGNGEPKYVVDRRPRRPGGRAVTAEQYQFCHDFALDATIRMERT